MAQPCEGLVNGKLHETDPARIKATLDKKVLRHRGLKVENGLFRRNRENPHLRLRTAADINRPQDRSNSTNKQKAGLVHWLLSMYSVVHIFSAYVFSKNSQKSGRQLLTKIAISWRSQELSQHRLFWTQSSISLDAQLPDNNRSTSIKTCRQP